MNAADFLGAMECRTETVDVPGIGTVKVKEMTGTEREAWAETAFVNGKAAPHFRERLLVACIVDEQGAPMFTPEHVEQLAARRSTPILDLYTVAARLNGLGKDAEDNAAKNS